MFMEACIGDIVLSDAHHSDDAFQDAPMNWHPFRLIEG